MKAFGIALPLVALALGSAACGSSGSQATATSSASTPKPAASGAAAAAAGSLKVGDAAPDVTMKLTDGKEVKLSSLSGKQVLVYFYPKDDTQGCTIEANGIKDGWEKFQAAGIEVYGVSAQDAESHKAFAEKNGLPFPLVVDEGGKVAEAFKVPAKSGYYARQSFLVGADGKIKKVWLDVDPSAHADSVLTAAKS